MYSKIVVLLTVLEGNSAGGVLFCYEITALALNSIECSNVHLQFTMKDFSLDPDFV